MSGRPAGVVLERREARLVRAGESGRTPAEGYVYVTCWCDEHVLEIPRAVFDRGETLSCGREGCRPPG